MVRDDGEQQLEVFHRDQVVRLCGLYKAVDHSAGRCSVIGPDHDEVLSADRERTDGLLCEIVIHGDFPVGQKDAEIGLLVDAVGKCPADRTVVGDLGILPFDPREIVVHFILQDKLTLFQAVFGIQIIEAVVDVEHFRDPVVGLLGDGTFGGRRLDGFDELRERSPRVDPASGNGQVPSFVPK